MNKGGNVGGGGPTAAAAAAAAQKQKSLLQRVDADIGNIVDNYGFIVNAARVCPISFTFSLTTRSHVDTCGYRATSIQNFKILCAIVVIKVINLYIQGCNLVDKVDWALSVTTQPTQLRSPTLNIYIGESWGK